MYGKIPGRDVHVTQVVEGPTKGKELQKAVDSRVEKVGVGRRRLVRVLLLPVAEVGV